MTKAKNWLALHDGSNEGHACWPFYSEMIFTFAHKRDRQKLTRDARNQAFALFCGTSVQGSFNDMNTTVEAYLTGKKWH